MYKDFPLAWTWPAWIRNYRFVFLALFLALAAVYGNSLDCAWHFDDGKNIVDNANIRMHALSWQEIKRAGSGLPGAGMNRPLAYVSFALNYYIGGYDLAGFHLTNLLIHYLTSLLLFLFLFRTLNLPLLKGRYGREAYSIALVATFLWTLHPIQVYAVTYIVQRMASMAALFFLSALFFYLLARTTDKKAMRVCYFVLTVLSAVLALATKENSVMLPLTIALYDLFLIRGITRESLKKYALIGSVCVALLLVAAWMFINPAKLIESYSTRPFTLGERLLTEPRVIVFYMSLLLYPVASRFTLLHDIDLSRGLFSPWTTLPAMLLVAGLCAGALFFARKRPLPAFCVVFFFLNHLVESSFLPLEIVYEHRNYLPSMLFFVPLAVLLLKVLYYLRDRKAIFGLLAAGISFFLLLEGLGVLIQNNILKTEFSLWLDNAEKSPRLNRVRHNLALEYIAGGSMPEAIAEFKRALTGKSMSTTYEKCETYYSLGQCYRTLGRDDLALQQFAQSLKLTTQFPDVYQGQSEILMARGQYAASEQAIRRALSLNPAMASLHLTCSELLLKKGDLEGALREARSVLLFDNYPSRVYEIMAAIFRMKDDEERAAHFLRLSQNKRGAPP